MRILIPRPRLRLHRTLPALGTGGSAAIEFALLLPFLMLFVLGSIEYGRAFYIHDIMAKSIRDATRYLARAPDPTLTAFQTNATNLALRGSTDSTQPLLIPNLDGSNTAVASVAWSVNTTTDTTAYDGTTKYVTGLLTYPFASPLMTTFGFRGTFTLAVSHNERAIGGGA
jgi:Flp pilus assembly protein TadG